MVDHWDVLGFGVVAVDDLLYVDHYPGPDSKAEVRERRRDGGGLTGTALVAASRLAAKAAFCGVLGDDEVSLWAIQSLERERVDCSPVLRRPGARPTQSVIIVDLSTGQRTIFFSRAGVTPRRAEEMTTDLIGRTRVLFVDHTVVEGGLRAIQIAHALGIPVVGDIESESAPGVAELMTQVDHLIVSVHLAARLTGGSDPAAMVRALASPQRACLAVTAGDQGCWYAERGGQVRHQPAFRVEVVDTTGCGDVFHGAYAACIAQGQSVSQAIRRASAAAALKATQPGGRAGIPNRARLERFLAERAEGS